VSLTYTVDSTSAMAQGNNFAKQPTLALLVTLPIQQICSFTIIFS